MSERDELRTSDLANEPGDPGDPDRTDREEPARDSWAREKLAQARDKLARGPAETVHREDTTGWDDEPAREQDRPDVAQERPDVTAEPPEVAQDRPDVAQEPPVGAEDRPNVTTPPARMAPDESAAANGGAKVGPLLPADDAEGFRARWTDIQNGFVDAPQQAVERADGLTAELMQHLAASFADERARLERHWDRGDDVSTDSLRGAFQRYRSFFERLLTT